MEARLYFSAFVLTLCAIHLISTASAWIDSLWKKNVSPSKKRRTTVENIESIMQKKQVSQRSDWYAFFHCSDLVGNDPVIRKIPSKNQNKIVPDRKNRLRNTTAYSR